MYVKQIKKPNQKILNGSPVRGLDVIRNRVFPRHAGSASVTGSECGRYVMCARRFLLRGSVGCGARCAERDLRLSLESSRRSVYFTIKRNLRLSLKSLRRSVCQARFAALCPLESLRRSVYFTIKRNLRPSPGAQDCHRVNEEPLGPRPVS